MENEPNKIDFVETGQRQLYEALGVKPEQITFAPCNSDGTILNTDLEVLNRQLEERPGFRIYYRTVDGNTFAANLFTITQDK